MNWIKKTRDIIITIFLSIVLYSSICIVFYSLNSLPDEGADQRYDSNTIRATYPNYANEDHNFAVSIFYDYAGPKSSYRSFVGYRRQEYKGETVTVDSDGFRKSINHSIQNSVWFLGGSTMWGTGADDNRTIPSLFAERTGEKVLNLGESGFNSLQELIQLQIMLSRGYSPKEVFFMMV